MDDTQAIRRMKLVYSGADNGLYILDIFSGQISTPTIVPALLNVAACQVIPSTNLNGEIVEWVK